MAALTKAFEVEDNDLLNMENIETNRNSLGFFIPQDMRWLKTNVKDKTRRKYFAMIFGEWSPNQNG